MVLGGVLGAILGAVASQLFSQADAVARERDEKREPQGIQFSIPLVLPFALTIISLLRQISALAKDDRG